MNERGYTLIEMAVVVLLIGVMIGIAVPKVRDTLADDNLRKSARKLIATARQLRGDAVRNQVDYELHIDLDRQRYWAFSADTTVEKRDDFKRRASEPSAGVRIREVRFSGGERRTQGEAVIRFYRKGYMQPARLRIGSEEKALALVFNPYIPVVDVVEGGEAD